MNNLAQKTKNNNFLNKGNQHKDSNETTNQTEEKKENKEDK